ncbi:hypothetical protein [Aliivibrio fischeri]|uniref:hypothetical protein n=1 Tax=Aliivibrio fischeri TaxID=668 RepID=UPI00105D9B87|nr:hypothetical protein [Aliivibrio fischeri]TDM51414.1 hypothetical protein VFFQA001_14915 [Aliivibrio fischeri]
MPMCDEFPELYFPDDNGDFVWDKPGWGDSDKEEPEEEFSEALNHFSSLADAKAYALAHPGITLIRNPQGDGFVIKGTVKSEKIVYRHKQEAQKRTENERLGRPRNAGLSWNDGDLAKLLKLHTQKLSIKEIATQLERSPLSISAKLFNLELLSEHEHQSNLVLYSSVRF